MATICCTNVCLKGCLRAFSGEIARNFRVSFLFSQLFERRNFRAIWAQKNAIMQCNLGALRAQLWPRPSHAAPKRCGSLRAARALSSRPKLTPGASLPASPISRLIMPVNVGGRLADSGLANTSYLDILCPSLPEIREENLSVHPPFFSPALGFAFCAQRESSTTSGFVSGR